MTAVNWFQIQEFCPLARESTIVGTACGHTLAGVKFGDEPASCPKCGDREKFLQGYRELVRLTGVTVAGCGCCGSPWLDETHDEVQRQNEENLDCAVRALA